MKGVRSDTKLPSRRGRRRIVAERVRAQPDDPSATVIEANRQDEMFRAADGSPDPSVVKSAHRVLRIFEYFDEIERPAAMTEIARRLNYPPSSTSALLKSLVELGYLDHGWCAFAAVDNVTFGKIRDRATNAKQRVGAVCLILNQHRQGKVPTLFVDRRHARIRYLK